MTKDIKDYLHLYLGCAMEKSNGDITHPILLSVKGDHAYISEYDFKTPNCDNVFTRPEMWVSITFLKPILRPLSDMTEEEEAHMVSTQDTVKLKGYPGITLKVDSGETVRWMLSKGFDLFGLIPSGLAIDKTKLTTP